MKLTGTRCKFDQLIQTVAIGAIPVLFAITLHEAAHGYVARHFGDMTADKAGRISLNPLHHIDPFGTVLLPLLTLWMGGILFGWAKPVPVNFAALRHPKKDMLWVAIAGPCFESGHGTGLGINVQDRDDVPGELFCGTAAGHVTDRDSNQCRFDGAEPVAAAAA